MKSLEHYFNKAKNDSWAIPQFNISNIETLKAISNVAKRLKSPVIIGTSEGESGFLGIGQTVALVRAFREEAKLPIFLNLDHGKSFDYCKKAIDSGYDTCHFDGSRLSLKENIKITKKVVECAHKKGILVEGEIDEIGSANLTDPDKALFFCENTGVDRLAVNVGTFHGKKGKINISHLKKIKSKTGDVPLVLHGGSGVSEEDIKAVMEIGIAKINVNTELRIAFTKTLKDVLFRTEEVAPYKYMPEVIEAVKQVVEAKIKLFGSRNKA